MRQIAAVILLFGLIVPVAAQGAFTVTQVTKTAAHPYFGQGSTQGFAIDEVEGAQLTLQRGQTYTFQMSGVPSFHPFYIGTSPVGAGATPWSEGVTGNLATGSDVLTFTVPGSAPNELWYQCGNHERMGWKLIIAGSSSTEPGIESSSLRISGANPTGDRLAIEITLGEASNATVDVLSVDGRRVALIHDGPMTASIGHRLSLDTSDLAAGIYVVRATAGTWAADKRITIVR